MPAETPRWLVATRLHTSRATIADVARVAGVHKGTASRALRGVSGVGEVTRKRILQAADTLDYSASHLATALATGQSKTVGIVLPTLRSWYFNEVAAGAHEVLAPAGFRVELINLDTDSDYLQADSAGFRWIFNELGAGRGRDALLLASTYVEGGEDDLGLGGSMPAAASGLPLTSVPGIFIDHAEGGRLVGEHLVQLGHRDIAIVDGRMAHKREVKIWEQRTAGLRRAVGAIGMDVPANRICYPGDCRPEDGEHALSQILAMDPVPTAVFCHTDELAFGLLSGLRQTGLSAPRDLTVVSFDDHPMSRYWGLSTVSQHAYEQGVCAAQALVDALSGARPSGPPRLPLTVELIVRDTSGPPRAIR